MRRICCILLLVPYFHQVIGNLNIWVSQKMLTEIIRNLQLTNTSRRFCPPDISDSMLSAPFPDRWLLVRDGIRLDYVHWNISGSVIPPATQQVSIMWSSSAKHYYTIEAKSGNLTLMHHPTLNVPVKGRVPRSPSGLSLSLACTGIATGITPLTIKLNITEISPNTRRQKPKSVTINENVYKKCLSKKDRRRIERFHIKCRCKRKCRDRRRRRCCMIRCRRRKFRGGNRRRCRKGYRRRNRRKRKKKSKDRRKRKKKSRRRRKRKRGKKEKRRKKPKTQAGQ